MVQIFKTPTLFDDFGTQIGAKFHSFNHSNLFAFVSQQVQMSQSDSSAGEQSEKQKKTKSVPHLINLNEDPMLSRVIFHFLEQGKCCVLSTVKPLPVLSNLLSESPIFFLLFSLLLSSHLY